jgi:hypothetical protein
MEKRSRHRIRDLVALTAIQGLSQNEIGCARISVMARSKSAPFKGRIQKRKTNYLQIIISSLQRTAGPYKVPCMDGARGARGESDVSANRSGAAMYSASECSRSGCGP